MSIITETHNYILKSWVKSIKKRDNRTDFILPYDFVPPCIDGELTDLYYWDTYFTNLGLINDGMIEYAYSNIQNLIFCLRKFGCVPNMCRANGADYASQPPLLFLMIKDYYEATGDLAFLADGYEALKTEYLFWMTKRISDTGLNRYGSNYDYDNNEPDLTDFARRVGIKLSELSKEQKKEIALNRNAEGESGHDYTTRFNGRAYEINAIDLNSYLYGFETTMADFAIKLDCSGSDEWLKKAEKRKKLMKELCFDKKTGVYFDYDFIRKEKRNIFCGPCYLPYVFGLTDDVDALNLINERLVAANGVLCCEKLPSDGLSYQWGYPNSWAPYNYFAYVANYNSGNYEKAREIAKKYLKTVSSVFDKTGKMFEKYDAITGDKTMFNEYGLPEMLGWTAGVYEYFFYRTKEF